jgi:hypothetical protein
MTVWKGLDTNWRDQKQEVPGIVLVPRKTLPSSASLRVLPFEALTIMLVCGESPPQLLQTPLGYGCARAECDGRAGKSQPEDQEQAAILGTKRPEEQAVAIGQPQALETALAPPAAHPGVLSEGQGIELLLEPFHLSLELGDLPRPVPGGSGPCRSARPCCRRNRGSGVRQAARSVGNDRHAAEGDIPNCLT